MVASRGDGDARQKGSPALARFATNNQCEVFVTIPDYPEFGRKMQKTAITNLLEYLKQEKLFFRLNYKNSTSYGSLKNDDFVHVKTLGCGAFSCAQMVRKLDTGIYYAKKMMAKHYIVLERKVDDARNEKRILQSLRFPFTINLKFFYMDNMNLYFVLPLVAGGELYVLLRKVGKLPESTVQFVTAQIVLAIEYLHYVGVVHRDLKLENVFIDHFGYVKVGDFGLSKYIGNRKTFTLCGTAEYMAPEVLDHKGYGLAIDWWSLGVIIYELCCGSTPFFAEEINEVFFKIENNQYSIPLDFSNQLTNLIDNFLQTDVNKRFGNLKYGADDIKTHKWYKNINWLNILNRKILSPIVPFIADKDDNSFFTPEKPPPTIVEQDDFYGDHFKNF